MLLRHSLLYLFARGLPALANFIAVAIYTELLSPEAYGQYSLVYTAAAVGTGVLFWWLGASLERFLPSNLDRSDNVLSTVVGSFVAVGSATLILGALLALFLPDPSLRLLAGFTVALTPILAWHDLNLILAKTQLLPLRYGLLGIARAGIALGVGVYLVYLGAEGRGPLIGIAVAAALSSALFGWSAWNRIARSSIDLKLLRKMLRFGIPLALVFALNLVMGYADRFIIGSMLGIEQAGLYAAAYDLPQQSIGTLLGVVSIAGYPHIVRALEQRGATAAEALLVRYGTLLVGIAVPSAVGFVILSDNIAWVVLGEEFRNVGARVMPWIAVAAAVSGVSAFYFNLTFQLGGRTQPLIWVSLTAAVVNVACTVWLVPRVGVVGAAYAAIVAYTVAATLSVALGRRLFALPSIASDALRIAVISGVMALVLAMISAYRGFWALIVQISTGAAVSAVLFLLVDIGGMRSQLRAVLMARRVRST